MSEFGLETTGPCNAYRTISATAERCLQWKMQSTVLAHLKSTMPILGNKAQTVGKTTYSYEHIVWQHSISDIFKYHLHVPQSPLTPPFGSMGTLI